MSNKTIKQNLHTARVILSFALLGAVVAGTFFGWADVDPRPWGAALGASGAITVKLLHLF